MRQLRARPSLVRKLIFAHGRRAVTFIGMPGSGKSYWARRLAKQCGAELAELDADMEAAAGGVSLLDMVNQPKGESLLRYLENKAMFSRYTTFGIQTENPPLVVSTGGSAVYAACADRFFLHPSNLVVHLDVPYSVLHRRTEGFSNRGIVFNGLTPAELHRERAPLYKKFSDVICCAPEKSDNADALAPEDLHWLLQFFRSPIKTQTGSRGRSPS